MSDNIQQTIIDLFNQASLYGKDNIRVQHLRHIQELILRKNPTLLDQFLEEILSFQTDKSIEVKKSVISFIEEACQFNPEIIIKVIDNLHFLLYDDNIFVQKKLILSLISIYKSTLIWLLKSSSIDETITRIWRIMIDIKNHILSQLNSNNDGLCLVVIKFIEMFIIILIENEQNFILTNNKILSKNQLEQEIKDMIEKLIEFTLSQNLSNIQLITSIEAINNIIRYKSDYIERILQTFEILHKNLPSTLNEFQIENVCKLIKLKLFNILKYSASYPFQSQIINLLTNLGSTQTEIIKYLPKINSEFKRKSTSDNHHKTTKKSKNSTENKILLNNKDKSDFQHSTINDLVKKLSIKNVVDLVISSMKFLPEQMPTSFESIYTPIKDAGSHSQIEYLAYLLNTQLISTNTKKFNNKERKSKSYIIKPIEYNEMKRMSIDSFNRILYSKDLCEKSHINHIYKKIINSLICLSEEDFQDIFKDYLIDDIHQRYDLAFTWIYQEYIHMKGYLTVSNVKKDLTKYDKFLCQLIEYLKEKDTNLFYHLLTNIPLITDNVLLILEQYCQNENSFDLGIKILHNLLIYRIPIREKCLNILFNLTTNKNNSMRNNTINIIKILYKKNDFQQIIEKYALKSLNILQTYETITEDLIHLHLSLYLYLIPLNHYLIQPFINFYTTVNDNTQQILVHSLIPILPYLEKSEVKNILPKLIKLPSSIVKIVFNQFLVSTKISPSELLIILHEISLDECELKLIINATTLCLNQHSIYTDLILSEIIEYLVEITPIPLLFMRTVIQTYCLYPKMISFIINILQRLIIKQVWKQTRIWDGFIKCCKITRPHSFPILLQLPPIQLKHVFQIESTLHENLRSYLHSLSITERLLISSSIIEIIENK